MARQAVVPDLTEAEARLLPLLASPLSLGEIGQVLELPRDEVTATARSIFAKLGVGRDASDGW